MRLLNRKKDKTPKSAFYAFTLIEITLAIGIVAIGMAGIMALFPIGFNATRDAIGDNYSSDFADQFLHAASYHYKNAHWSDAKALPSSKPSVNDDATTSPTITKPFQPLFDNIYQATLSSGTTPPSCYYIESKSGTSGFIDFSAQVLLWKTVPTVGAYDSGTNSFGVAPTADDDTTPGDIAVIGLNMEISWPAAKPYSAREKRVYYLEITKPKP